ncbi:hypothetical protein ACFU51_06545, partial [Streptomyces sp. NPDC057430]
RWNPGHGWNGEWFPLPGQHVFDHQKQRIAAVSRNPEQLDLFVVGFDNKVYSTFWNPGHGWNGEWFPLPGQHVFDHQVQRVAAVSRNPHQLDLFVVGFDNKVYSTFWVDPAQFALRAIEDHWNAQGAHLSKIGLPVGNTIAVRGVNGGYQADFRSGVVKAFIHEAGHPLVVEDVPGDWVRVWWVGVECGIRQEAEDEIYGTVYCHAPGRFAPAKVAIFPGGNETLNMGKPGARVALTNELLYEGPLVNVTLGVTLLENDSGDVEEISREVADKITEASASLLSGLTGVPAEAVNNQTWYKDGIGSIVGLVLDDLFGIGDDAYLPAAKLVQWETLARFPSLGSYQRPGEPQVIPAFSDFLDVTGVDDAGDRGHYRFYFLFEHANPPG